MASRRVTRGATQSIADRWSLPLSARLEEGLRRLGASRPLPIQAASCGRVFAGESVAIHSQTGTGKTLAYLLPLVARLRPAAPRQILTVVPSYELGRQTLEFAHDLAGARTAALLPPAKSPADRAEQLLEQPEPLLIVTGAQLGALLPALEDEGGAALRALRATLMAVVLDEPDAILRVPTYSTMTRRHKRNAWLARQPLSRALAALCEREKRAEHARIQLVLASATLSGRLMKDVHCIIGRERVGRVGLAHAAGAPHAVDDAEAFAAAAAAAEADLAAVPASGRGVRGGVLSVGVPVGIRHHAWICDEEDKGAAVAAVLRRHRPARALLVVRDGLRLADVRAELKTHGVHAAELPALLRHEHDARAPEAEAAPPTAAAADVPAWVAAEPAEAAEAAEEAAPPEVVEDDEEEMDEAAWRASVGLPAWTWTYTSAPTAASASELERAQRAAEDAVERAAAEAAAEAAAAADADARTERAAVAGVGSSLLVAHESAIRGLDLAALELVVVSMMPSDVESYVHIAGRCGRVGAAGDAVCVMTQGEWDDAGVLTRALGVRWRVESFAPKSSEEEVGSEVE